MSKMSELDLTVKELLSAAQSLISVADSLAALFGAKEQTATSGDEQSENAKKVSVKNSKADVTSKPDITENDVRRVLAEKSRNGFTAEVKALLTKAGVAKVSQLEPKQYSAILAEAEEIK